MAQIIHNADVFRITDASPSQAQALLNNIDVAAVITIPADFTQRVNAHVSAPIDVTVNNLNLDFTNDIRRSVPDAITQYYHAQGATSAIKVTMQETDLRHRDVQFFQYNLLPTILLLLMISGLINGGLSTAREWESHTVKELLLAPVSRGAIIAGKVLAGFAITFILGTLVLLLGYVLGWTQPQGVYWLSTLLTVALVSLFSAGLGVAIGAALRRIQVVIAISINAAIYLFFLAGGIGVLAFEPGWLQSIAAFVPLTYGRHALEQAVFYSASDQFGLDMTVLTLSALAAVGLGVWSLKKRDCMELNWKQFDTVENTTVITTVDVHAAGEPLRIITGGLPELPGATILERRRYMQEHFDHIRRALMWEPRGHRDMYGCVLTQPVTPEADLGVLFMHNEGYSTMCGHGIIALVTALLETGALPARGQQTPVNLDTPAGLVRATAHLDTSGHVEYVSFLNVPSFVFARDVEIDVPAYGRLTVDVAFGGAFYAFIPAAQLGLSITPEHDEPTCHSRGYDYKGSQRNSARKAPA